MSSTSFASMDGSLSVSRLQTLALISFSPLCISPHSSNVSEISFIRESHIRFHRLQSRRKCSNFIYPFGIVVRASTKLVPVSDVIVMEATWILLSLSYFESCRPKMNVLQGLRFPKYSLFELVANFLAGVIDSWIAVISYFVILTPKKENHAYLGWGEICDALGNMMVAFIQSLKSVLAHKILILTKASQSHIISSNIMVSEEYMIVRHSFLCRLLSASYVIQALYLPKEWCAFFRDECLKESEFNYVLCMSTSDVKSTDEPSMSDISLGKLGDPKYSHHAYCEKNQISSLQAYRREDYIRGKLSMASWRTGPFEQRNMLRKTWGFAKKSGEEFMHRSRHSMGHVPSLKFMQLNDQQNTLNDFRSSYNSLLKDGRLKDCIELLESMKKLGLLDMNEVYHTKFFNICKHKKAVKEAFWFTKLIPSPSISTFNMLMSVCASSQDFEGAFQVLLLLQEAKLRVDCKLYTTLISTCAKSGKVDAMFEVFHEMLNNHVEPNVHTYGALIDGCARAGHVAKAFGAYGMMIFKKVKPDRVVFNALITACGKVGAVDRAFDVFTEMKDQSIQIDPDHITVGALMKACTIAGQADRVRQVYKLIQKYHIKGTPEVYTIALNSCSQSNDWDFACSIYKDMISKRVVPDEIFLSALIDVAGHAGKVDAAFSVLHDARMNGQRVGIVSYSSLMGACCNAKSWEKAVVLYEEMKSMNLKMTVSAMNALITALCDAHQVQRALGILSEMKGIGLRPNKITYSVLLMAVEKMDDLETGLTLLSQAKVDGVALNLFMCQCLIGMCLRRYKKACALGENVLTFNSGMLQLDNKWSSSALMVYRETIVGGVVPSTEVLSQLLGCLQLPHNSCLKNRLIESLGISSITSKHLNLCSLVNGFGEYDPRALSLFEEAASLGIVPTVSLKQSPIVVDVRNFPVHVSEVYLLTVLKGLKYRLAAGAKLPDITVSMPIEKVGTQSCKGKGVLRRINICGRVTQGMGALLRRVGIAFEGSESCGRIRIQGISLKRWLSPKFEFPGFVGSSHSQLARGGIGYQQREIRNESLRLQEPPSFHNP